MKTKYYEQNEGNLASQNINHTYFFFFIANQVMMVQRKIQWSFYQLSLQQVTVNMHVHVVLSLNYDAVKFKLYQI